MSIYTPYTYLIGWSNHNKWYYGVRYAKNCHPSDLWKKYFTSSKIVEKFREEYGEPDDIQIRKTFRCSSTAIKWEEKVLKRLGVLHNDKWLNRNIAGAFIPNSRKNYVVSQETRKKISLANKNKIVSEETKIKMSISSAKKWQSEEYRDKMLYRTDPEKLKEMARKNIITANATEISAEKRKNKPLPETHRKNISLSLTGKTKSIEHVNKINKNPEKIKKTAEKHRGMKRTEESRRKMSEAKKGKVANNKGKIWVNNGKERKMIDSNQIIPVGYTKGYGKRK